MPQITEGEKTYWLPDDLPEPTEEYKNIQSEKSYLTKDGREREHPGWTYASNCAYVDDEYLFQNEGWKLIVDDGGAEFSDDDLKHKTRNAHDQWEINEKTVKVTYTITDFTQEETDAYIEEKWQLLRGRRDYLLSQTDWIISRATEENLTISSQVTSYRQQLRNFPSTVTDILKFNIDDNSSWPAKPEVYFEV
jgi:hypothetical protein|tara:strand:+ start:540 stop:1118 length:579 start_codon:yes stop_codon:yes gene_type:complete